MQEAERFVASLHATREDEEQRREALRRRRIDCIIAGKKERTQRSKDMLSVVLQRGVQAVSLPEDKFLGSLGDVGRWWDLISEHILEEKRECEEAVKLQKRLNSMYLTSMKRREEKEQSTAIGSDERRLRELEEWCLEEERRTRDDVIGDVVNRILLAVDACIGFTEKHALEGSVCNTLLGGITLNAFIRTINGTSLTGEERARIAFTDIFHCHPFQITGDAFLYLLYAMYDKLAPDASSVNCFDISCRPLFVINGPKFSGKTVVSREVSAELSLLSLTDRDLTNKALQAYRNERNGLPTLVTVEDSNALPVLSAYEEHNVQDEEIVYHSESRIEQVVESFVRLSPWAKVGKTIEAALFRGEAVDPYLIVELMQLEMADTTLQCEGILFDGTVGVLGQLCVLQRMIPKKVHLFEGVLRDFPPRIEEVPLSTLLLVPRETHSNVGSLKSEVRPRPPKKGVDLSALPPPVLPEVTRPELTEEENNAIAYWEQHGQMYSLFSAVVHIDCRPHEIFGRFAGLRVDKETGEHYHMVFSPPPTERLPYLVSLDRVKTSTAQLHRLLFNQNWYWETMRRWLKREEGCGKNVHEVNGERALEEIIVDVRNIIQEAGEKYKEGIRYHDAAMAAKKRRAYIDASIAEQEAAQEAERKRLIAVYAECGAPIPPELESRSQLSSFYTMPDALPEAFMRLFCAFRTQYESAYDWLGTAVEKLANVMLEHRFEAMDLFNYFWNQQDEKQEKLDQFVANYNGVPPEILGQPTCKEELHQLVDQLREELFRTLEATEKEASTMIEQITKKESFSGPWCVAVCNVGVAMVQVELERFLVALNLVAMYFAAVVNEPCNFEELESEVILVRSTTEAAAEQTKGKEKKMQSTKKAPQLEEVVEKTLEDTFVETVGKIVTSMENLVGKFSSVIEASVKVRESAKTSAMVADDGRTVLILKRCLPFVQGELSKAQERISCIRQFFLQIQREGEAYCTRMKDNMLSHTREKSFRQASAVNTAIYIIRNAIEEERPLPPMHLGRDTFHTVPAATQEAIDHCLSSSHKLQILPASEGPKIHATLSSSRLVDIIIAFRSVAPDYALGRTEFFYIVRPDDYAGATARNLGRLKTPDELFAAFDPLGCGFIDWREFVVHLLLWCAPVPEVGSDVDVKNNFYIPECSITELLEIRTDLGPEAVTAEVFYDIPFFFDNYMADDRLEAYVRALWMTFSAADGLLDPMPLLVFLCIDRQPIRGTQKAFYVLSQNGDGVLTSEELDFAFHVRVTNPRNMCLSDVFSPENIATLYDGELSLAFQSVGARVIGRTMLNHTDAFHRKSFLENEPQVK
ncbi:cpc1/kpl2 [Trypanosoma rangeli]|uniref:Cpc1/kpl2 n=1 Tax=Trypanosoma rangeli TaxID=5698 RepID=A0A422NVU6_TRYRA|nr:cpc1/kpl2 [Trypanosoma rangeli]RNF09580.1 cpc1/kpl2 [Trypanosoma rangeli]|eukprot:RNF09580.1 cpc1/kpl2 [Trypanosoma rangeli]